VPGISRIDIGPSDLGLKPMLDREEPQVPVIYDKLLAATRSVAGPPACTTARRPMPRA
jgi:hypothetical protein